MAEALAGILAAVSQRRPGGIAAEVASTFVQCPPVSELLSRAVAGAHEPWQSVG